MRLCDWTDDFESHIQETGSKLASSTAREWQRNVSRQTISRRLKAHGLRSVLQTVSKEKQIDGHA